MAKKRKVDEIELIDLSPSGEESIEQELSSKGVDKLVISEDHSSLDIVDIPDAGFQNLEPIEEAIDLVSTDMKWKDIIYGIGNLINIPVFTKSEIEKIAIVTARDLIENSQALESLVRVKVLGTFVSEMENQLKDYATDEAYSRGADMTIRGAALAITKGTTTYSFDHDHEYKLLKGKIAEYQALMKPIATQLKEREELLKKHASGTFKDEITGEEIVGAKPTTDGTSESIRITIPASIKEEKPKRGKK